MFIAAPDATGVGLGGKHEYLLRKKGGEFSKFTSEEQELLDKLAIDLGYNIGRGYQEDRPNIRIGKGLGEPDERGISYRHLDSPGKGDIVSNPVKSPWKPAWDIPPDERRSLRDVIIEDISIREKISASEATKRVEGSAKKFGMGGDVGGTIGAIGGSFIPIPGGTIAGAAVGRFIGGLFDNDKRPKVSIAPKVPQLTPPPVSFGYMAEGGFVPIGGGRAIKVTGPSHERGGVMVGDNAEVEGGETIDYLKKGGRIHIKPSRRGSFTKWCGGKVTSECIQRGLRSKNPAIRKKANFARNARKWNKKAEGGEIPMTQGGKQAYVFSDELEVPDTNGMSFAEVHELMISKGASDEEIQQLAALQEQVSGRSKGTQQGGNFAKGGRVNYQSGGGLDPLDMEYLYDDLNFGAKSGDLGGGVSSIPKTGGFQATDLIPFVPSLINVGAAAFAPKPVPLRARPASRTSLLPLQGLETNVDIRPQLAEARAGLRTLARNPNARGATLQAAHVSGLKNTSALVTDKLNRERDLRNTRRVSMSDQMLRLNLQDSRQGFLADRLQQLNRQIETFVLKQLCKQEPGLQQVSET
jgi:hypothetical protein